MITSVVVLCCLGIVICGPLPTIIPVDRTHETSSTTPTSTTTSPPDNATTTKPVTPETKPASSKATATATATLTTPETVIADAVTSPVSLMTSLEDFLTSLDTSEESNEDEDIIEGDIVQREVRSKPEDIQYLADNAMVDFDDPSMRYESTPQKVPYPELSALSRGMGGSQQSNDAVQGRSEYYDGSVLRGEYWYTAAGTRWTFSYISDQEGFHMTGIKTEKEDVSN